MPIKILVADDEPKITALVASYLEASGFTVTQTFNGLDTLSAFQENVPACLILDINMPGMDGLSVAREIRKKSNIPIIFLTARTDEIDRIVGFELGADDYVPKPFSPRELVARVKAVLRRQSSLNSPEEERLVQGSVILDPAKRTVMINGKLIDATTVQFDILAFMMRQPGRAWSRLDLLGASSDSAFEGYERTIDAHIKNIRKCMGDDSDHPRYIETIRGIGYRFMEQKNET